jgi:hypothetical protein
MIDFIKFRINEAPTNILNNPLLNFSVPVDIKTGEIKSIRYGYIKQTCEFQNMLFEYIQNIESKTQYIDISGSLHKFYQGNNYTDFTLVELQKSILDISEILGTNPQNTRIRSIEFGVNITPKQLTNQVLDSIICFMGKPYKWDNFKGKGYLKRFSLSQFEIKIYNKGLHCLLNDNLMRFELNVNKMDYLLTKDVQTLSIADLLKTSIHQQLRDLLESALNNLYFIDYRIDLKQISNSREKLIIIEGSNPGFWNKYRESHSAKGYQKKVKRFKELNLIYSPSNLQTEIKELILAKWDQLNSTPILPSVENTKVPHYYTHIVGKIEELNKRYCLTCKREITKQKKGSQYCSEKLNGREVKKCRNEVSNLKQHENRFYKGPTLFDVDLYLKPYYQQIKTILKCS